MYNLAIKSIDIMKKTKDTLTSQLTLAEKQNLVACLATTGITHISICVLMNSLAEFAAVGTTPSPRTVAAETADWCDVIHAQDSYWGPKLKVIHRGAFGQIEGAANSFGIAASASVPLGTAGSASTDGSTTYAGKYYNYLYNHVGNHVATGDIFAPAPEATIPIFAGGNNWPGTGGAGLQANYSQCYVNWHAITDAYAAAKGVTTTFMTHHQYSEARSGWIPAGCFTDSGSVGCDFYGHYDLSPGYRNDPEDYVSNWETLYTLKGNLPMFWGEWGDMVDDAIPFWAGKTIETRLGYLIRLYRLIRDRLVDTGKMTGFNYWGGWDGQNTSILFKTGSGASSQYFLNARGKILQAFYLNQQGFGDRIPVITRGTGTDSYGF